MAQWVLTLVLVRMELMILSGLPDLLTRWEPIRSPTYELTWYGTVAQMTNSSALQAQTGTD
jgi:hypothetical protein